MNPPNNEQSLTMTSREISELTGKRHPDVKRDIEVMCGQLREDVSKFARTYTDSMNRSQTEYVLDKAHTECLVTGYSALLRMKVIQRMYELEENVRVPKTLPEALRLAAALAEKKAELDSKLAIAASKAQFVDNYLRATGLMGFRETAKLLQVKENDFRLFLIDNHIMYRLAGKMTPYSQHLDAGRFAVKTGSAGNGHTFTQVKFTPKGIQWVANKLFEANKGMAARN